MRLIGDGCFSDRVDEVVEVLLLVHRNRRFIRDGSPGRPPRVGFTQLLSADLTAKSGRTDKLSFNRNERMSH